MDRYQEGFQARRGTLSPPAEEKEHNVILGQTSREDSRKESA
jgi:hypothetical protein